MQKAHHLTPVPPESVKYVITRAYLVSARELEFPRVPKEATKSLPLMPRWAAQVSFPETYRGDCKCHYN